MKDGARSVQIGLLILVILIPLIVFRPSRDCFLLPKETFSQILILGILACWLINSIKKGKISLHYTPLNKPILAFILTAGLSLLFALSPYNGLRELRCLVSYGLVYFLLINNIRGNRHTDRLVIAMILAGLLSSLYGILQYYGIDFFTWIEELGPRRKVFSTHGNVQFLAGYLIVLLPVALGFLLSNVARAKRLFAGLATVPIYICLIMTYSRGAWLSLLISILVMGVIIGRRRLRVHYGKWMWTVVIVVFLITVLFSLYSPLQRHGLGIAQQVSSLFDRKSEAVAGRLLVWRVSSSMMKKYPLLGIGPGNFKFLYPDYLATFLSDGENAFYRPYASRKLRAHNDYLQVGVEMGLVGLCVLGWCICALVIAGVSSLRRAGKDRFALVAGFAGGMFAMAFNALIFFPFQVVTTGLFFFLITGLLFMEGNDGKTKSFCFAKKLTRGTKFILIELILVLAIVLSLIITRPLVADVYYRKGLRHVRNNELTAAMADYLKALSWDPDRGELHFKVGHTELSNGNYDRAIEEFQKSQKTLNSELIYYHMGNAYARKGMGEEAIGHYEKAIAIDPGFGGAHASLGNVYAQEGRWEEARHHYEAAMGYDANEIGARLNLANYWFQKGNRDKAIELWKDILEIDPENEEAKKFLEKFGE